jgi:hypothetical protein
MKYISNTEITQYELDSIDKFTNACHNGKWGAEGLRRLLKLVSDYGNIRSLNKHCKATGDCYNTLKHQAIDLDGTRFLIEND